MEFREQVLIRLTSFGVTPSPGPGTGSRKESGDVSRGREDYLSDPTVVVWYTGFLRKYNQR